MVPVFAQCNARPRESIPPIQRKRDRICGVDTSQSQCDRRNCRTVYSRLGHQFLRHIQRTKILAYIIDICEPDIKKAFDALEKELKEFDDFLLNKQSLIVITKTDTVSESDLKKLSKKLPSDYIYLSAVTGGGIDSFKQEIEKRLDQLRA